MTDMPGFGILCAGKSVAELARSVQCGSTVTALLKQSGYEPSGYHTALLSRNDKDKLRLCRDKLYHLTQTADLVVTVGGDGFSRDDVIPELTAALCEKEAVFFSLHLSGAGSIGNYEQNHLKKREHKQNKCAFSPSASRAGCCGSCLILNIRNDEAFIETVLPTILPSVSFAVAGISGKDPEESLRVKEDFASLYFPEKRERFSLQKGTFHFNSKITP